MTNALDFLIRMRTSKKGGVGLPPRAMRDSLMAEHLGPAMLAKLGQVYRARRRRGIEL